MVIVANLFVLITIVLSIFSLIARNKRKNWANEKVVYLPFYLAIVGMVCGSLFCIPTVVSAMDGEGLYLFFGAFVLLCDSLMMGYLNCVIFYDEEGFCVRNFFGIRRECAFGAVEGTRFGKDRRIFLPGASFTMDEISIGAEEFWEALQRGYRRANGKHIPTIPRKLDPMNGHIDHPWFYFFLWIFLGLICLAMPVLAIVSMTAQTNPAEVTPHITAFSRYEIDDGALKLYAGDDSTTYIIDYYRYYGDAIPAPEELISGELYQIGTTGKNHYIKSLADLDGNSYITYESEREIYRKSQLGAAIFMGVMGIAGAIFSYLGIAVARHPHRYSQKFRQLFYKDGTLYDYPLTRPQKRTHRKKSRSH